MTIEAELADGRILEFPDGTDPSVIQATVKRLLGASTERPSTQTEGWTPYTPSGEKGGVASITPAEAVMGHPVTQFAVGAAEPILGAAQAVGFPIDAKSIQEMSERGAQLYGGNWTRVPARLAGNVLSPAFLKLAKALGPATTLGQLMKAGATMGAVGGATTLQEGGNDPVQRAINAGMGAAAGAAVPPLLAGGRAIGRQVSHISDLFRGERGASNILDRYIQRSIGEQNVPVVSQQLRAGGQPPLPGYRPTVAEAVSGLPEGSPLVAHQRITAATPGGPSAQFGHRLIDQKAAIKAAEQARDATVVPRLLNSIKTANQAGIQTNDIVSQIDNALQTPGFRASDVVSKSLNAVKDKITSISKNGLVDGEDLWTVRKEIGNTIKNASKETANWDKRLTAGLERQIQKAIDDAIVKAGGTDWPTHMAEYAARSQAIQAVKDTAKTAMRPVQRTDLYGGLRIAEETRTHLPQMLSRPMMLANAIMNRFSAGIEPHIDKAATQRYLDPLQFADALDRLPPQTRNRVIEAMTKIGIAPAVQQIIRAAQDDAAQQPQPAAEPEAPRQIPMSAGWVRG